MLSVVDRHLLQVSLPLTGLTPFVMSKWTDLSCPVPLHSNVCDIPLL